MCYALLNVYQVRELILINCLEGYSGATLFYDLDNCLLMCNQRFFSLLSIYQCINEVYIIGFFFAPAGFWPRGQNPRRH